MAAWRYEISLLVLKKLIFHSFAVLTHEIFSTLEETFHISARPCNILYLSNFQTLTRTTVNTRERVYPTFSPDN